MTRSALRANLIRMLCRTVGIAMTGLSLETVRMFVLFRSLHWTDAMWLVVEVGHNSLVLAFGLTLALELREVPSLQHHPSRRRIAVGVGAALAVIVGGLLAIGGISVTLGVTASEAGLRLYILWNNTMVALCAVGYLSRRRESREAEQCRLAMVLRLEQARRRLDALANQTSQSRLEPQMIFDCLIRAREVYPVDMRRGDALLDSLAHYLRLTLGISPQVQATLAREAELAAARIDVERAEADTPMVLHVAAEVADVHFPADLLGPVAHDWLHHPQAVSPRMLRLQAHRDARSLQVRMEGPCPAPDTVLSMAAHSLNAFSGKRGTVRAEAHALCLEIDHV